MCAYAWAASGWGVVVEQEFHNQSAAHFGLRTEGGKPSEGGGE